MHNNLMWAKRNIVGAQIISGKIHINLGRVGALEKGAGWLGNGMELGCALFLWNLIQMLQLWNFFNRHII